MPDLYIIAGPNGAGKTTASMTILPKFLNIQEFVNADSIAAGLSPFKPGEVAIQAGNLMLQRIEELLGNNESFAIETTLSSKNYLRLIKKTQQANYTVVWYTFGLNLLNRQKNVLRCECLMEDIIFLLKILKEGIYEVCKIFPIIISRSAITGIFLTIPPIKPYWWRKEDLIKRF